MLDAWMHDEWMHGQKDTWMYGCVTQRCVSLCFQAAKGLSPCSGRSLHYWGGQCPKGEKAAPYCRRPAQAQANGGQGVEVARRSSSWQVCRRVPAYSTDPVETESRGLPTSLCLWLRNGRKWPPVLHPLAGAYGRTILLVHWCLERWLGAVGHMCLHGSVGNRALLWCFLLQPTKALGGSCNPNSGHPFLPCIKGCLSGKYAEEHLLAYASAYSDWKKSIFGEAWSWSGHGLQRRRGCLRLALMLTVDGRECQITPLRTRNVRMWKSNNPSLQVLTQSTVSGIGVSQQQNPKTSETSTNVSATLFTQHNKDGMNSVVTCCYVGSSVHLLILRNNMHSCMTSIKSSNRQNLLEKLQMEIKPQKHVSAITQSSQIIQTCKVPLKSKWKSQITEIFQTIQNQVIAPHP